MREEDRGEFDARVLSARSSVRLIATMRDGGPRFVEEVRGALADLCAAVELSACPPAPSPPSGVPAAGLREGGAVAPDGTCLYATDLLRALAAAGMILEWKVEAEYGSSQASLSLRCLSCLRYGGFHGPECPKVKKG